MTEHMTHRHTHTRTRNALLMVDMSIEQVDGITYKKDELIQNIKKLLDSIDTFDLKIDSRLWLNSPEESSLSWVFPEAAKELFVAHSEGASLIPHLRDCCFDEERNKIVKFQKKNNYSCFAKSDLLATLHEHKITHVYICGINTDYCIFATAMDSFSNDFRTFVLSDAVSSCRGEEAHEGGLRNLERHFGSTVLVGTNAILSGNINYPFCYHPVQK